MRKEKRVWLNEQAIRLGRLTTQRQGTKYLEIWEEGEGFKKLHQKLKEITNEKEEIERLKKNRKSTKVAVKKPAVPTDGFGVRPQGPCVTNEASEYDLEESEFNNIDKNEQKEIYQFK